MKLILLFCLITLNFSVYSQCCGDGICDPGEDSLSCAFDCPPITPVFNCPNTVGSFFTSPTWPVNFATAQANGWCYTFTPPYPATICFEYLVPPSTQPVQISFIHSACNTSSVNQGNSPGGCNSTTVVTSAFSSSATYDGNCNVISNTIQTGGCYTSGEIITVCLTINSGTTCDPITICPVVSCGTSDCSTGASASNPICPPFLVSDTSFYTDLCNANSGVAVVTPDCGNHFSYLWNTPAAQTDSLISGLNEGIYNVVVSNDAFPGCDTTISFNFPALAPLPNPIITGDFNYCNGEVATLDAGGPYSSYTWSTGQTNQIINPNAGNGITVTVTNVNGCSATSNPVNVTGPPEAIISANPEIGGAPLTVTFSNQSVGGTNYYWNFGNDSTLLINDLSSQQQVYDSIGTYTIFLVVEGNGCLDTTYILVNVIDPTVPPIIVTFPNVFTPNGDDVNDFFTLNASNIIALDVTILDRWGLVVFQSNDINFKWNGKTSSDVFVKEGVYFYKYKITGLLNEVLEGHNFVTVQFN